MSGSSSYDSSDLLCSLQLFSFLYSLLLLLIFSFSLVHKLLLFLLSFYSSHLFLMFPNISGAFHSRLPSFILLTCFVSIFSSILSSYSTQFTSCHHFTSTFNSLISLFLLDRFFFPLSLSLFLSHLTSLLIFILSSSSRSSSNVKLSISFISFLVFLCSLFTPSPYLLSALLFPFLLLHYSSSSIHSSHPLSLPCFLSISFLTSPSLPLFSFFPFLVSQLFPPRLSLPPPLTFRFRRGDRGARQGRHKREGRKGKRKKTTGEENVIHTIRKGE